MVAVTAVVPSAAVAAGGVAAGLSMLCSSMGSVVPMVFKAEAGYGPVVLTRAVADAG